MIKKIFLLLLLVSIKIGAQQNNYNALIEYQMPLINPAHAGADSKQYFIINSRNQWSTLDESPKTLSMAYSFASGKNVGLGLSVISDQIFVEKQTTIGIDFSYKLTLNNETNLYLGLKGGLNSFKVNTENLIAYDSSPDPAKTNMSRLNPNVGIGLLFKYKTVWISTALPRLFNAKRNKEIFLNARDRVHFYFASGTTFPLKNNIDIEPRFIYRTAQGIKSVMEGVLWAKYKNKFSIGLGVRTGAVTSFKMKLDMTEMISLSYAYDAYGNLNSIMNQFDAHEIGLKFQLNNNILKNNSEEESIEEE